MGVVWEARACVISNVKVVLVTLDFTPEQGREGLLHETIAPRSRLPPLLAKLDERPPEHVDYIGVAYGLTAQLYRSVSHRRQNLWFIIPRLSSPVASLGFGRELATSQCIYGRLL